MDGAVYFGDEKREKWARISNADRCEIEILRTRGYSIAEVAESLKRPKSAIGYETRKRRGGQRYDAAYAKHLSYVRMRRGRKVGKKIALDPSLRSFVEAHLLDDQSPDAIAGRLRRVERDIQPVSPAAIKRYVASVYGRHIEAHRAKVFKKRRRGRRPKASLAGKRTISKRPHAINQRKGVGHMEGDFIVSGKSGNGMALVLVDRNIRKALLEKILPVSVRAVERALLRMRERFPDMRTITFDNDLLLLEHRRLERKLGVRIYFCHPRSPWEKPSVENLNRWIRRYAPKGSNLANYSRTFFRRIEAKANRRFMECLGFRTPDEMYARARKRKKRPQASSEENY